MRIVLDTNVLISGLISPSGPPGRLLDAWFEGRLVVITSPPQIGEISGVLRYERIARRLSPGTVDRFLRNMQLAELVEPSRGIDASPDPDDNVILATAIAGDAALIVSGDKRHMLGLGRVGTIPIVTPAEALKRLKGSP